MKKKVTAITEVELSNNPDYEAVFLVEWGFKDKDGNVIFKCYSPVNGSISDVPYTGKIIETSKLLKKLKNEKET